MPNHLSDNGQGGLTRRTLLSAVAAAAGASLLGACSQRSGGNRSSRDAACLDDLELNVKAPPDIPGSIVSKTDGTPVAWSQYPKAYQSVANVPGSGGPVTTFQILYSAPPTELSKNVWWQKLNERLGVSIEPNLAPSDSYGAKLNTLAASGSFPDITYINFSPEGASAFQKTLSQGAFHDLTPLLTGSALEEFPNLQLLPEYVWKGTAFEGKLYGVPRPVQPVNGAARVYREDWAKSAGTTDPQNADDVFALLTSLGKSAGGGRNGWAMASFDGGTWDMMFGVPNGWRLEDDGTLTKSLETDEYRQSLEFAIKLWKAGLIHPDAATITFQQSLDLFASGRTGWIGQGFVPMMGMCGSTADVKKADPKADVKPFIPPGFDGGDPVVPMGAGTYGFGAIPSSIEDEDRVKELLRIMDYYTAPFGSEEYTFMNYGIEGRQYRFADNGAPVSLNNTKVANEMTLNYLSETSEINFFYAEEKDATLAKLAQDTQAQLIELSEPDPTQGLYSPADVSKGASLDKMATDYYNGIVTGRRPITDLDEWRERWKSRGGDEIRGEYQDALGKCQS